MPTSVSFEDAEILWVVHIGNDDKLALRAREENFVCIGWAEIGDLTPYRTRQQMRAAMERAYPNWKPKKISSSFGQLCRFAHEMRKGEPVVFPVRPTGEIAIGRISGDYRWSNDPELVERSYNNVRPVEWLKIVPRTAFSQAALHSFGSFLTISTSSDYLEEVITVLADDASIEASVSSIAVVNSGGEDETAAHSLYETAAQETEDYLLKAWQNSGVEFEHVVAAVFEALGYTATVTSPSGDHGIDVIAHPDPLGLERPYIKIQVKSGMSSVGEPEVNQLRGQLNPGEQGVFISLAKFTSGAESVARGTATLTLIGAKRFVRLFLEHYDGLAPEWRAKFPLKKVFLPFR